MASDNKDDAAGESFEPLYIPLEDVEPFERYRPGGYHPAQIGDRLHDRYKIVHKLGFGSFSTTWLARDEQAARYVAVKIAVAETEYPPESDILRLLGNTEPAIEISSSQAAIPPILDEFEITGPNGSHQCLVTAPARMSVAESREASYKRIFQPPVARAIAAQLIQAIAFLHSRGVVHSDLHEGNILLRLPRSIDSLSPDQLYERYGQPELEPAKRLDDQPLGEGVPSHGVVPIWLGDASEDITLPESHILLTDFGESFQPATTTRCYSHTPYILRPPELFFLPTVPLSFPADIWSLACAIFAILGQRPLFETWFPSDDRIIEEHVDTLGHLPPDWWTRWANRSESFNEQLERTDGAPRRPWAARFEYSIQEPRRECGMAEFEEDEKASLSALLLSMLAFKPEDRPSAQQVLESDWVAKWALPELDRACGSSST
jgi:serine/threonine protein kinase